MATENTGAQAKYLERRQRVLMLAKSLASSGSTLNITVIAKRCRIDVRTARDLIHEAGLEHVILKGNRI
jgi:predicted transcriptional regulator